MSDSDDDVLLAVAAVFCATAMKNRLISDSSGSNYSSESSDYSDPEDCYLEDIISTESDKDPDIEDEIDEIKDENQSETDDVALETLITDSKVSNEPVKKKRKTRESVPYYSSWESRPIAKETLIGTNLISEEHFDEILSYVKEDISKKETLMRSPVPVEERLATILLYLIGGHQSNEIAQMTKISKSLVCNMISAVCEAIYINMKDEFLKFPETHDEWREIAEEFETCRQFPLCLGAVDCRHVSVFVPRRYGDFYKNSLGYNSIIILALCDAGYKFIFLDVGYNGSATYNEALSQSPLQKIIFNQNGELPDDKEIGCYSMKMPYVFVGDEAFALEQHLMKPYLQDYEENMNANKFNQRLQIARTPIDVALGMLWNRFKILQFRLRITPEKTSTVVRACCVLHNYFITKLGKDYIEPIDKSSLDIPNDIYNICQGTESDIALITRDEFTDYFCY